MFFIDIGNYIYTVYSKKNKKKFKLLCECLKLIYIEGNSHKFCSGLSSYDFKSDLYKFSWYLFLNHVL